MNIAESFSTALQAGNMAQQQADMQAANKIKLLQGMMTSLAQGMEGTGAMAQGVAGAATRLAEGVRQQSDWDANEVNRSKRRDVELEQSNIMLSLQRLLQTKMKTIKDADGNVIPVNLAEIDQIGKMMNNFIQFENLNQASNMAKNERERKEEETSLIREQVRQAKTLNDSQDLVIDVDGKKKSYRDWMAEFDVLSSEQRVELAKSQVLQSGEMVTKLTEEANLLRQNVLTSGDARKTAEENRKLIKQQTELVKFQASSIRDQHQLTNTVITEALQDKKISEDELGLIALTVKSMSGQFPGVGDSLGVALLEFNSAYDDYVKNPDDPDKLKAWRDAGLKLRQGTEYVSQEGAIISSQWTRYADMVEQHQRLDDENFVKMFPQFQGQGKPPKPPEPEEYFDMLLGKYSTGGTGSGNNSIGFKINGAKIRGKRSNPLAGPAEQGVSIVQELGIEIGALFQAASKDSESLPALVDGLNQNSDDLINSLVAIEYERLGSFERMSFTDRKEFDKHRASILARNILSKFPVHVADKDNLTKLKSSLKDLTGLTEDELNGVLGEEVQAITEAHPSMAVSVTEENGIKRVTPSDSYTDADMRSKYNLEQMMKLDSSGRQTAGDVANYIRSDDDNLTYQGRKVPSLKKSWASQKFKTKKVTETSENKDTGVVEKVTGGVTAGFPQVKEAVADIITDVRNTLKANNENYVNKRLAILEQVEVPDSLSRGVFLGEEGKQKHDLLKEWIENMMRPTLTRRDNLKDGLPPTDTTDLGNLLDQLFNIRRMGKKDGQILTKYASDLVRAARAKPIRSQ